MTLSQEKISVNQQIMIASNGTMARHQQSLKASNDSPASRQEIVIFKK